MNSMTGYGRATAALGRRTLTIQVGSVNRKTLDLSLTLPREWERLEVEVSTAVRRVAHRGKVHVSAELTGETGSPEITWAEEGVARTVERLRVLAEKQGVPFAVTPELLWRIASAERQPDQVPDADESRPVVLAAVDEALRAFAAMRAQEGAALHADLTARVAELQRQLAIVAERAPQVPATHRELLLRRLRDASLELDLDDERVLKELALFADRCDISEELTRLRSHLEQLVQLLNTEGEMGRKAEFILQEVSRESHTIGSKANDLEIAKAVIEFKNELERVREQMANVE